MTSLYQPRVVTLGLGAMRVEASPDTVVACLGLGSCVALCVYDPMAKAGGMAHMVLPASSEGRSTSDAAKFVDQAVPRLIEELEGKGGRRGRFVIKLVGGAQMIGAVHGEGVLNIGQRNAEAAHLALLRLGLRPAKTDLGGSHGRTVRMYLDTGRLTVSVAGGDHYEL